MARTFSAGNNTVHAAAVLAALPLTMACWFKPVDTTTIQCLMELDDDNDDAWRLDKSSTATVRAGATDTTTNNAVTTTTYSAGVWHHACGVFASATDRRAFLNGGGKGTTTTSRTPTGIIRTRLGLRWSLGAVLEFTGDICEAAIWNIALADADVALLATGRAPYAVQRASVVAYWPLLGGESPEPDPVGGFSMTLTGTPPQVAHRAGIYYGMDRFQRRGLAA